MTDEEEFEARSLLKWQRVNALEWALLYRRKKMGRVISDKVWYVAVDPARWFPKQHG